MKSLHEFLMDKLHGKSVNESKTVTFDFTDLENGEETLKSLEGKDGVTVDGQKLKLEITPDNVDKIGATQDILQQFCSTIRNSSKRTNDETYAQKTKEFEKTVGEMNDAIDEIEGGDDDDDKKDDEK